MSEPDPRYAALVGKLNRAASEPKPRRSARRTPAEGAIDPNPPKGEKGDFFKITVSLSPDVYRLISDEVALRKSTKAGNAVVSAIIREAIVKMLERKHGQT
jgi:hypothetical protein